MSKSREFSYRVFGAIAISLTLFGCGGDDAGFKGEETPTPPITTTLYYAQDTVRQSAPTDSFYVDLSKSMETSDGTEVSLTSISPLIADDSCDVLSQDNKGFTISAEGAKVCDYRFRVGSLTASRTGAVSGDGYAEATVRAAVGVNTEVLSPISSITSSNTSVVIDILRELGRKGYTLDENQYTLSSTVTLPNVTSTNSTAIANSVDNTVEYTPGSGIPTGVERILYSYSDGSNVLSGTIDVAISTDTNTAPTAQSTYLKEYIHPESGEAVSKAPFGLAVSIDVKGLIGDPDGDVPHLINVFSYDARLTIPEDANKDGNKFNDTMFEFTGARAGIIPVTYVVSDGKGGYATGVVQVIVAGVYSDILVNDSTPELLFKPPLTAQAAEEARIKHSPVIGDGVLSLLDVENATHDWVTASGYCEAAGGRLPTIEQLNRLHSFVSSKGGLFNGYDWPQNKPYWSSTEGAITVGNKQALNLDSGTVLEDETQETSYYVTCISQGSISVEVIGESKVMSDVSPEQPDPTAPDKQYNYQLEATSTEGTETIDDSLVTWTADGNLPHYASLSNDGVLTVAQSKVISTDRDTSFSIMGCYESQCDDLQVSVVFPWNGILTDGVYEFSPLMTAAEAGALYVALGQEDTSNHSYKIKDSTLLKKEWQEIPPTQGDQYCDLLAAVGYEGGEWKAIDTTDVASSYVDVLAEKMNVIGVEGSKASEMVAAFNLQTSSGELSRFDFNDNLGGSSGYYTIFVGTAPNITQEYTLSTTYPYSSYYNYANTHVSHAVCYRLVK
ncbi:hypothetical protein [Vibrio sp. M260121]|uniref:hypothetical protein n=1 Tax=Vibrio sp. M260121 TaxID=3020897 RepID=UPI002F3ED918